MHLPLHALGEEKAFSSDKVQHVVEIKVTQHTADIRRLGLGSIR